MISTASSFRVLRSNRGSALAAALALAFLILAVTTISLARVASISADANARRNQTAALFLAEAGIQKAGHALTASPGYTGEKGTRLATGYFDVRVERGSGGCVVTSTGYADSPFKRHPRKSVRATISVHGGSFGVSNWREDP